MPIVWQGEDATIETTLVPTIAGPAAETCPGALLSGMRAGEDATIETNQPLRQCWCASMRDSLWK